VPLGTIRRIYVSTLCVRPGEGRATPVRLTRWMSLERILS
jgi:hypothetical protein